MAGEGQPTVLRSNGSGLSAQEIQTLVDLHTQGRHEETRRMVENILKRNASQTLATQSSINSLIDILSRAPEEPGRPQEERRDSVDTVDVVSTSSGGGSCRRETQLERMAAVEGRRRREVESMPNVNRHRVVWGSAMEWGRWVPPESGTEVAESSVQGGTEEASVQSEQIANSRERDSKLRVEGDTYFSSESDDEEEHESAPEPMKVWHGGDGYFSASDCEND